MNMILRTATALAAAIVCAPAFAANVWPDVDFEWYADGGRYHTRVAEQPKAREGYIWTPAHWETGETHQRFVAAHWVVDDFAAQTAIYNSPAPIAVVAR